MKVLLIIFFVLLLINLLPAGVKVKYDESGIALKIIIGFLQFPVFPKKEKVEKPSGKKLGNSENNRPENSGKSDTKAEKKAAKKQKAAEKKLRSRIRPKDPQPLGAKIEQFLPFVRLGLRALGNLRWLFVVRNLKLRVVFGGMDAGETAENYGKGCAIIGMAMSTLTRNLRIQKYDVCSDFDFAATETRITADARVILTVGAVVIFALRYGWQAMLLFIKMKTKEKAVQRNESSTS